MRFYTEPMRYMDHLGEYDKTKLCLIQSTLEALVPIAIADLQRCGGPTDLDRERCAEFGWKIGSEADTMLYKTKEKGKAGTMMGQLCKHLATMAFVPGGVTAFGLHFEATVQEESVHGTTAYTA